MMTLGTNNATFTGLGIKLDGPLAYVARRLAYHRMPTLDHQLKVGFNWITSPILSLSNQIRKLDATTQSYFFRCRWHSVWRKKGVGL